MNPMDRINEFRAKLAEWRGNWHRVDQRDAIARELVSLMEATPTLKLIPAWDVLGLIQKHAGGNDR